MNHPTKKTGCLSTLKAFRACIACLVLIADVGVAFPAGQARVAHRDAAAAPRFKAIAFDYFVLFNPDSVVPEVERAFPGKGREFTNLWRTRQFEYSWLRSITNRYVDFFAVTEDALIYTASAMKLQLTPDNKRRLLDAYLHLTPWPDAVDALRRLKASGIRIITIANFSPTMLRSNAENAGLTGFFDALVSTDANHTYKPDPRAYRLGMDCLHLAKKDILSASCRLLSQPAVRVRDQRARLDDHDIPVRAATGVLKPLQIVPTLPSTYTGNNSGAEIAVAPSGRFVYGSNRGHDSIAIFAIDGETGMLSVVGWESTQGRTPRYFGLDPSGTQLYAANQNSDTVVIFRVNQTTGKLAPTGEIVKVASPSTIVFR